MGIFVLFRNSKPWLFRGNLGSQTLWRIKSSFVSPASKWQLHEPKLNCSLPLIAEMLRHWMAAISIFERKLHNDKLLINVILIGIFRFYLSNVAPEILTNWSNWHDSITRSLPAIIDPPQHSTPTNSKAQSFSVITILNKIVNIG